MIYKVLSTVWCVFWEKQNGEDILLGVCSTKEKAEKFIKENWCRKLYIEEFNVD